MRPMPNEGQSAGWGLLLALLLVCVWAVLIAWITGPRRHQRRYKPLPPDSPLTGEQGMLAEIVVGVAIIAVAWCGVMDHARKAAPPPRKDRP
jgi:hypothetical protein